MGLSIEIQVGNTDLINANRKYIDKKTKHEILSGIHCTLKPIDTIYHDWALLEKLDCVTAKSIQNCEYVLLQKDAVHNLEKQDLSDVT